MRRSLFLLTLLLTVSLFFLMNQDYSSMVYKTKQQLKSNIDYEERLVKISGHIIDYNLDSNSFVIKLSKFADKKSNIKWLIKVKDTKYLPNIIANNTYEIEFIVDINQYQYTNPKNQYAFDYDKYLFSKGITGQYFLKESLSTSKCELQCIFCKRLRIRTWIQCELERLFDKEKQQFLTALILGDKTQFEQYTLYKNLGLAHIFAISGLHFGVIYHYLRRMLVIKSNLFKSLIVLLVMGFMLLLVGGAYSAQRAFLMIFYSEICHLLNRKPDITLNLSLSLLIILCLQPMSILSSSLHLSYYAYICVAILYRKIFKTKLKYKIFEAVRFSVTIQILLLPATLYYFQNSNVYSFVSNVLLVPLIGIILPLSLLMLLSSALHIGFITWILREIILLSVNLFEILGKNLPLNLNYFIEFKKTDFYGIVIYMGFISSTLVFWKLFMNRKSLNKFSFVLVIILLSGGYIYDRDSVKISFFDVSHGDMSYIHTGAINFLIDTGDSRVSVNDLLRGRGVHRLDFIILSHAHEDHIGGLFDLLEMMEIGKIYVNASTYEKIMSLKPDFHDKLSVVTTKTTLNISISQSETLELTISPIKGVKNESDPNDDALIVALSHGNLKGYFLGDISTDVINDYIQNDASNPNNQLAFIKSAHHGSKTSISELLYKNYAIKYVITSCGSKYNMPSLSFNTLLAEEEILHYTTYENGEIKLTLSENGIKIKTYLNP